MACMGNRRFLGDVACLVGVVWIFIYDGCNDDGIDGFLNNIVKKNVGGGGGGNIIYIII